MIATLFLWFRPRCVRLRLGRFSSCAFYSFSCLVLAGCSDSHAPSPETKTAAQSRTTAAGKLDKQAEVEAGEPSTTIDGAKRRADRETRAAEIMAEMRRVYRQASSYTDNAAVVFYAVARATGGAQETPYTRTSVAYERPNKLSMTYHKTVSSQEQEEYQVVANGVTVRSAAKELPDQIHEAICPLEISIDNFIPEPSMRGAVLENAIENTLPQLALLFDQHEQAPIFPGEENLRLLPPAKLDGESFDRLELRGPAGKRVLWVDQVARTLRRMEIPIDNQREQINRSNQYAKISVWIDFHNVTIDPQVEASTFELAVPAGAQRVRRFIPPPPAGPPERLGQMVGNYDFQTLEGEVVTPARLAGKITVLDFWSTNCHSCQRQAPVLQQVYEHFADSEEVAFYAVSTDSRAIANQEISQTMASWGGSMPLLRDLESSGYHELDVRQTPTLLLVDRNSRLQVFQSGAHQDPSRLIQVIQRMVDGEDLVATDRQRHERYIEQYEQAVAAASIEDSIIEVEMTRPTVDPQKLPEKLRCSKLWQLSGEQLQRPGDVLTVVDDGRPSRYLVLDGVEAIVELDLDGQVLGRHELPAHQGQTGGFLRNWSGDQGQQRRIVASGVGWQKVFVFDENWELVLSFPDESHSGIGDVLLADLADSGTPVMIVGYWGGLGVQGGTLDGRRLWANRNLDHVLQIGTGRPVANRSQGGVGSDVSRSEKNRHNGKQTIWCTSTRGTMMHLASDGKSLEERYIAGHSLMYFASQSEGQSFCGLSIGRVGHYTAVGFDGAGSPTWQYPLPPGEYYEQVPRVHSVRLSTTWSDSPSTLGESGQSAQAEAADGWLIAAANGSLHWLDGQGELVDRFDYGDLLTGLTIDDLGDQSQLLVATPQALTAWQVRAPLTVKKAAAPEALTQAVETESAQPK